MQPRLVKPEGCRGCSLEHSGFGFAIPSGPTDARLRFIGESLGYHEAIAGEAFVGAAGGTLTRVLMRAGIDRKHVAIGNVVSCRPPNDALVGMPYEEHAIAQCRQFLQPVIDAMPDGGVIVPLGVTALASVLNLRGVAGVQIRDFHGTVTPTPDGRGWVVPSFHTSHLQRGAMNLLEVVTQDVQLASRIAQHGFRRSPSQLVVDPHPDWLARWVGDHLRRCAADPTVTHLALDTEFAEKAGGVDESEIVGSTGSPITRVNGGNDPLTGWSVPYRQPYISLIDRLIVGVQNASSWCWLWNKYADLDHLRNAGHAIDNYAHVDGMWLWRYLQSDLPRGLGFVAAMASDFGAWKHWGKDPQKEGAYAAADGLQTWRTAMWLLRAAAQQGVWDVFLRDWHERDVYCLRPAHDEGVPINRQALENFHAELQAKLASVLVRIKQTAAAGVMKPKAGYGKCPLPTIPSWYRACTKAKHTTQIYGPANFADEAPPYTFTFRCDTCSRFETTQMKPPASIMGKPKKGGGEAKSAYMLEGVRLVEKIVEVEINVCQTCGAESITKTHRCKRATTRRKSRKHDADAVEADRSSRGEQSADGRHRALGAAAGPADRSVDGAAGAGAVSAPVIVAKRIQQPRYFWQLPFNPDAPAQVLAYLASQGIDAPIDKKKQRATTNKKALKVLQQQHRDDPFFQLQLDWKAVQKVDSTYCVGSLARLDKDDRLHPEFLPKPSTGRDSCQDPNLQNVVADKAGPEGLASGFRRCVEARDGIPSTRTDAEVNAWRQRWGSV